MMNEIYRKGPIVCSISTPRDFTYGYRRGIWSNEPTKFEEIDHNVEVAPLSALDFVLPLLYVFIKTSCAQVCCVAATASLKS